MNLTKFEYNSGTWQESIKIILTISNDETTIYKSSEKWLIWWKSLKIKLIHNKKDLVILNFRKIVVKNIMVYNLFAL